MNFLGWMAKFGITVENLAVRISVTPSPQRHQPCRKARWRGFPDFSPSSGCSHQQIAHAQQIERGVRQGHRGAPPAAAPPGPGSCPSALPRDRSATHALLWCAVPRGNPVPVPRRIVRGVPPVEALVRRPSVDQRPVDAEAIHGQQLSNRPSRLASASSISSRRARSG